MPGKVTFQLEQKCRRPLTLFNWIRKGEHWQCGTVQIRILRRRAFGRHDWGLFVKVGHRWLRCYAKSRPWMYGSAGQAKRGLSKITELIIGDPPR